MKSEFVKRAILVGCVGKTAIVSGETCCLESVRLSMAAAGAGAPSSSIGGLLFFVAVAVGLGVGFAVRARRARATKSNPFVINVKPADAPAKQQARLPA
eukprot:2379254-Prymnesium_polylepis.1